jgi:REP element-mobilizing transposase RayT
MNRYHVGASVGPSRGGHPGEHDDVHLAEGLRAGYKPGAAARATARSRARKAPAGKQLAIPALGPHGGARAGAGRKGRHAGRDADGKHGGARRGADGKHGGARRGADGKHGGARRGAGRKPTGRTRVAHRARPQHKEDYPVHITLRTVDGIISLRRPRLFAALRSAIARSQRGAAFRITDFSVEPNHGHFITEAVDREALGNGVRALVIRLTLAIRRITGHRGPIWADRYYAHELRSPREYRNALSYVLNNWKKHVRGAGGMDPCSSAPWFSGWSDLAKSCSDGWASAQPGVIEPWKALGPPVPKRLSTREADMTPVCPVVAPETWLAKTGWLTKTKLGPIQYSEEPAGADGMKMLERAAREASRASRAARKVGASLARTP